MDKTEVSLDEFLQFTVSVEGAGQSFGNPQIRLPNIEDDFNIVATSQSNNINFNAGQMQMVWQVRYTLLPKKEGSLKIYSVEILYEGKTYKTDELNITVNPAKNPPQNIPQQRNPQPQQPQNVPWSENEGVSI